MTLRPAHAIVCLVLVLALAGCGSDKSLNDIGWPLPGSEVPQADSPLNLVKRFEQTFEFEDLAEYGKLLTEDFRFRFSELSDPLLVDQYPNWDIRDEKESTRHLFEGFTNTNGEFSSAPIRITLTLTGITVVDDSAHADSMAHYRKVVVTDMSGTMEFPGQPDPLVYSLSSRQEFLIVRGDAAVLVAGLTADSTRWYLRQWNDRSARPFDARRKTIDSTAPTTYGRIKAQYRD